MLEELFGRIIRDFNEACDKAVNKPTQMCTECGAEHSEHDMWHTEYGWMCDKCYQEYKYDWANDNAVMKMYIEDCCERDFYLNHVQAYLKANLNIMDKHSFEAEINNAIASVCEKYYRRFTDRNDWKERYRAEGKILGDYCFRDSQREVMDRDFSDWCDSQLEVEE